MGKKGRASRDADDDDEEESDADEEDGSEEEQEDEGSSSDEDAGQVRQPAKKRKKGPSTASKLVRSALPDERPSFIWDYLTVG